MARSTIHRIDPPAGPGYLRAAKSKLVDSQDDLVHVDFAGVAKICSSDLNDLIALNGKLRALGRELVLVNVPDSLMEILQLTRLDRLFRIDAADDSSLTS